MTENINQNPEQRARDKIDKMLIATGWVVQPKKKVDLSANKGVAVKEYQTDVGPADYVLFVDGKPVGIIEAKPESEGVRLTQVEDQSHGYATSKLKHLNNEPLPFVYESTGALTRFTNYRDPKPRSRPVFSFHQPATLVEWFNQSETLRAKLKSLPVLDEEGLRPAQKTAIKNLEISFKDNKPKALIQMATGAGKTFTACTFVYRLLKFADAKRILFLVDTRNLGEQAEQEFLKYQPTDDNRKFTELYNVQRLNSSYIASDSQVCISTIQRLYSILKGEELDETLEEENPNEKVWQKKEPMPVEYTAKNPIEQFDFVIIDECHRSIYNLWKQIFQKAIGTAMPNMVGMTELKELVIPVPSIEEQKQIVQEIETRLSVCDNILRNIEEGLEKAEALRQSILKKAFEGKLLNEIELAACRQQPDWEPAEKLLARIQRHRRDAMHGVSTTTTTMATKTATTTTK